MNLAPTLEDTLASFHATRRLQGLPFHSLCYAPFVQLAFTPNGNVQVCCRSRPVPIGNVAESTLREIWNGPRARTYREALKKDVFPAGCSECEVFLLGGMRENHPIHEFDGWAREADSLRPTMFDFAMSNRCNLECVHCSGEYSSLIRAREGQPPIPAHYGDRFFEELREFLPGTRSTKFVGGEPFLQTECYRVWDMMAELCPSARTLITTNGTIWSSKVERVLEQLKQVDVAISLDGVEAPTMEEIRVNAKHATLMRNLEHFRAAARRRKASEPADTRVLLQMNFCVMRRNWRELGDFFLWADSLEASAWVTPVVGPEHESVFTLPAAEMRRVVEGVARQGDAVTSKLGPRNRPAFESIVRFLVSDLEARLRAAPASAPQEAPPPPRAPVVAPPPPPDLSTFASCIDSARRRLDAGDAAGALACIDAAERMIPDHPETWLARAWILGSRGQVDAALAATRSGEAALASGRHDGTHLRPALLLIRALLLQRHGEASAALRCVEERLALLPQDPEALRLREELRRATSGA
jgi:radical SAM protein with 4Fe4S-binding SPASM domain